MKHIRKILHFLKVYIFRWRLLVILLSLLLCLDFFLETIGLPYSLIQRLTQNNTSQNITFSVGDVHLGLFKGIRLNDIYASFPTPAGILHLKSDSAHIEISLLKLLKGEINLQSAIIRSLRADVDLQDQEQTLSLESNVITTQINGDQGRLELTANLNGISLEGRLELLHAKVINDLLNFREQGAVMEIKPEIRELVSEIARKIKECHLGNEEASIMANLMLDCSKPGSLRAQGTFNINDAMFSHISVTKLRGAFSIDHSLIKFEDVTWMLQGAEYLNSSLTYNLHSGSFSGKLDGYVSPATAASLMDLQGQARDILEHITTPLELSIALPETNLELKQFAPIGSIKFANMRFMNMNFSQGSIQLSSSDKQLVIPSLEIWLDKDKSEGVKGRLSYNYLDNTLSLDLEACAKLRTLCNVPALSQLEPLNKVCKGPIRMRWLAENTSFCGNRLKSKMQISLPALESEYLNVDDISLNINCGNGVLLIDEGHFTVSNPKDESLKQTCTITAQADISALLADKEPDNFAIPLTLLVGGMRKGQPCNCLNLEGTVKIGGEPAGMSLELKGSSFLDGLYSSVLNKLTLECMEYCGFFTAKDSPVELKISMPFFEFSKQDWEIRIEAAGKDAGFDEFQTKNARGTFILNSKQLLIKDIYGETPEGYKSTMDMRITFAPFEYSLNNLVLQGAPEIARSFIFSKEARDIYDKIWENIKWDTSQPPTVRIDSIVYRSEDLMGTWALTLQASIDAKNFTYGNALVEKADCSVNLQLPGQLELKPLTITMQGVTISGKYKQSFLNDSKSEFNVDCVKGTCDLGKILGQITPNWGKSFGSISFQEGTDFSCAGSFYLNGSSDLTMTGVMKSPELKYHGQSLENVNATWRIVNNTVHWDVTEAKIFEGKMRCTGDFNIPLSSGNALLYCENMAMDKVIKSTSKNTLFKTEADEAEKVEDVKGSKKKAALPRTMPGKISCGVNIHFMKNWAGVPYFLEGDGYVKIREADLWTIPSMQALQKLVNATTFSLFSSNDKPIGSITEMDAKIELKGTKVVVPALYTNGTIIALSGSGEYSWLNDKVLFQISGEALKEIKILSYLLKPLSWAFHAQLSGTKDKCEWKMHSGLRKLFISD